jgi:8-oxo-dGTP pyrophosphatase MutT (NUDIX family)
MNIKANQQIVIGGAVIFRENRGRRQFLLVRQKEDENWEIPKVTVRKGESSVRAVIRLASEQGGMAVRVLEEAGRATGTTILNAKSIPQKFYYYLMLQKGGSSELIGFDQFKWLDYGDALKKIGLKREKDMLKGGKDVLKEWEKTHNLKKQEVVMF